VHGTSYGAELSFTTSKVPPSVTTNDATNITVNSATINGTLTALGTAPTVDVSFQYGTTSGVYSIETTPQTKTTACDFQAPLAGLTPDTTYYYRAKANGGIHGISYGTEHVFTTGKVPPSVTTNNASNLTTNSATLNGTLTNLGTATTVNVSFQYGTQQGGPYPNSTPPQAMAAIGAFQANLTGLIPGSTYYYRAKADGGIHGTDYGNEVSFHTPMFPPLVATGSATNVTANSATLNGDLQSLGSATTVNVSFQYGTTSGTYSNETPPQLMATTGNFTANISSLTPGTTYYYRAKGDGGEYGTSYGEEHRFTTSTLPPSVTTNAASGITAYSATLNGNLDTLGTATTVNVSFQYGTTQGGPYHDSTTPQAKTATGAFLANLSSLDGNTTYYYRAKGDGGIYGTSYGAEANFTTLKVPPSVTTDNATAVLATSATLNGFLDSRGTAPTDNVSFGWGTSPGSYPNSTPVQSMTNSGPFQANISSLTALTTYYFVARADGGVHGAAQGAECNFTTGATPPSVSTGGATSVTASSATLNGTLSAMGTSASDNVSFQWGTSPGVYSDQTTPQAKNTPGDFTANLSGLLDNTTYYYRAMASGGAHGTSYGTEHSFTTSAIPPSVATNAATNWTTNTAFLNGNLTALGTATTDNVSFIYGTTAGGPYPNSTPPQPKTATGTFQAGVTGLTPFTTYYFKAKADGGIYGTSYGTELNFTTNHLSPVVGTGSATDIMTNAAILNGDLYLMGSAPTVNVSFQWGTTSGNYDHETTPQAMTEPEAFLAQLNGLTPNTTYYYRAKGDGGVHGIGYGTEHAFTTSALPPSATTNNASNVTASSAVLNGTLNALGTATTVNVSFQYGTTQGGPYPNVTTPQAMTVPGAFQANLTGLPAHTAHYFRAKADGGIYGTSYGAEMSFITSNIPPTVTTGNAGNITTTAARLNGNLDSLGSSGFTNVSFQYGTTSGAYTNETAAQMLNAPGAFFIDVTGFTRGTTYYYRAKAVGDGTGYGIERTLLTAGASYSVETATGLGLAFLSTNAGDIQNLTAVAESTLPTAGKPAWLYFPEGFFSFNIVNLAPGSTVTITIVLPNPLPANSQYWKFQNGNWINCTSLLGSNDGDNIITLTLTDGGLGDADGLANGTIVDPGGPGVQGMLPRKRAEGASTGEMPVRRVPPVLKTVRVSVSSQAVKANQPVVITAAMVNQGEIAGASNVALTVNGFTEQTQTVSLAPGAVQTVKFTVSKAKHGKYSVNINGQRTSFVVAGAAEPAKASHQGLVMALATAVLVILSGLLIVILRRRLPGD
jgi:phosphodiesterase/alkaline phosphatase D-like protein